MLLDNYGLLMLYLAVQGIHVPISYNILANTAGTKENSCTLASILQANMLMCVLFVLPLTWAQFPAVCNTQDSLITKTCCPNKCGSRGICTSVREEVERSWNLAAQDIVEILRDGPPNAGWPLDLRYQWPVRVFDRVCSCHVGWGGYDCSRCDFGYIVDAAGECVKRNATQLLVRQNLKKLSGQEQRNYVKLLERAKTEEETEWAVVDTEPEEVNGSFTLQNVSTYNMFVFIHALTNRELQNEDCRNILNPTGTKNISIDFAHRGSHFLTWNRHFLLLMEHELRRIGQNMGIDNFTLPYFDWTPTDTCLMFTHELLGTPEYSYKTMNVSGVLYENGKWPVVCDQNYRSFPETTSCAAVRTVCNVTHDGMQGRGLQRGLPIAWRKTAFLPGTDSIEMAVAANDYAASPFGFETRLEGFVELCAGEAEKCMFKSTVFVPGTFNNLHIAVHLYIAGHFQDFMASVNDPIFPLHHTNLDRVFESWLQKFTGDPPAYLPASGGHPGGNLNDYLVPLFPLKTNADMYKLSKELGYRYDGWEWSFPTSDFKVGCGSITEPNTCKKGGCLPPTVVGTQCIGCRVD